MTKIANEPSDAAMRILVIEFSRAPSRYVRDGSSAGGNDSRFYKRL